MVGVGGKILLEAEERKEGWKAASRGREEEVYISLSLHFSLFHWRPAGILITLFAPGDDGKLLGDLFEKYQVFVLVKCNSSDVDLFCQMFDQYTVKQE